MKSLFFQCVCIIALVLCRYLASAGHLVVQPTIVEGKIYGHLSRQYVFTCTATGDDETKPKALQWKLNGEVIEEDYDSNVYSRIQDDSIMLYFQDTKETDHGVYECSGIENGETKTVRFEFVLRQPIKFIDTNIRQSIRANREDDIVVCKAIATPGPQVSWIRKKVSIRNNDKYQITNEGLRIKNPTAEDEGVYTCQAYVRSTGELVNLDIEVEIMTVPKWVLEPQDTEAVRGQDVIIKCDAAAKPVPNIRFLREGIQVSGERYIVKDSQLTIRRVESADGGTFQCMAENEAGSIQANLRLIVLIGPLIANMETLTVDENRDVSFRCAVTEAFPPPVFRWKYADTQEFIENVEGRVSIVNTEMISELQFRGVRRQDRRNYTCVASNKAATTELTVPLLVRFPPILKLTAEARNQYFSWLIIDQNGNSRGAAVVLTCIAEAYPEASIKWYYRAQLILESAKYRYLRNEFGYSQLEVTPNDDTDFGVYTCEADNSVGKTQRDISLLKATPPQYQPTIEFGVIKPDSIQLTIRSPKTIENSDVLGMPVESYKIQWRLSTTDWAKPQELEPQVDFTSIDKDIIGYEIPNLVPDTEYVFRIAAVNKPGVGKWTNDLSMRTKQRRQPDPVRMLSQEDCGYATRCIIEWSPEGNGGSTILEYYVKFRKIYYSDATNLVKSKVGEWSDTRIIKTGVTKYEITGLESNTYYEVDINARNEIGVSASQPYRIKTMQGLSGAEFADVRRITKLNLGLIIGACVVAFLLLLLAVDLCCYFTNKCGIVMNIRKSCKKTKSSGSKPIYKEPKYEGVPHNDA